MVIGIGHPDTHSGKYGRYGEVCVPQGPLMIYEVPTFSEQPRQSLRHGLVW